MKALSETEIVERGLNGLIFLSAFSCMWVFVRDPSPVCNEMSRLSSKAATHVQALMRPQHEDKANPFPYTLHAYTCRFCISRQQSSTDLNKNHQQVSNW